MAPEVRVNGIAPGAILWPEYSGAEPPEYQKKLLKKIPLQKTGSPESIAQTAMFLLENDYITGEVIKVDGGRLL